MLTRSKKGMTSFNFECTIGRVNVRLYHLKEMDRKLRAFLTRQIGNESWRAF